MLSITDGGPAAVVSATADEKTRETFELFENTRFVTRRNMVYGDVNCYVQGMAKGSTVLLFVYQVGNGERMCVFWCTK
jgi:hypothetical protein